MPPPINSSSWTLPSLVGAYLDLILAYLLLCGATLAYLATKSLSLFGLSLPYCDDFRPHADHKIASVHASLRARFPFDSPRPHFYQLGSSLQAISDDDDEGSFSTTVAYSYDHHQPASPSSSLKSKGLLLLQHQQQQQQQAQPHSPSSAAGLRSRRRRRKAPISIHSQSQSKPPPSPPLLLGWPGGSGTASFDLGPQLHSGETSALADPSTTTATLQRSDSQLGGNSEAAIIRKLESMLEEEQAARAALYVELDKERSAAATAADEAMAMILRLQEEKAAVEMESRQYHRMVEEKSAYDEEEMEVLKEIIVWREREKLVLQKEVELYRQVMQSGRMAGQQLDGDRQTAECSSAAPVSTPSEEDPISVLHHIFEKFGTRGPGNHIHHSVADNFANGKEGGFSDTGPLSVGLADDGSSSKHGNVAGEHHSEVADSGYESSLEFQEKGMITMEAHPFPVQSTSSTCEKNPISNRSQQLDIHEEGTHLVDEENDGRENKVEMRSSNQDSYRKSDQGGDLRVSHAFRFEAEPVLIHDVHIIDDRLGFGCSKSGNTDKLSQTLGTSTPYRASARSCQNGNTDTSPTASSAGENQDIRRSCSDMSQAGQLMGNLGDKGSPFHLRRCSMSAVDVERSKLEAEVELLMKRLKIIQQGREKLSFSVEHREKETCQLQLLEEISRQLQEIRKITEPEKSIRQASLPPPSSKVTSKKQRTHSVSWGVHNSS